MKKDRREFLRLAATLAGSTAAMSVFPPSISRALSLPASNVTGSIADVQHVLILMQENRSFDHYFGTLRGVRGFGDRHPVPLASGKPVWHQSDGKNEIPPFHLDTQSTSALRVPSTPHAFSNAQAAWNQGKFGFWPQFKTPLSMGFYRREDIPFQFALAEAFTICDAHHCSVTSGTDPNRIFFWSGSSFNPERRRMGENCTDAESEPDNLRCWIQGSLPTPGYTYQGSALTWLTIPEVLERAGITWRIYQDPNDNWTGAMHGGLAFAGFRDAQPGSPLYQKGMSHWSLEQLAQDAKADNLPQVAWVLPPAVWSEHPQPSSPIQGAEFTAHVLNALTANPAVWSKTVLLLTFDENDGLFDHVPPPAPPSYNVDGTLAGKSTLDLRGEYFSDPDRKHLDPSDVISGTVRPWGLGPRVPLYVISPWSRGGWVNSQVFDHTSVGQFLERRFGIEIPAISPWHRAVCGDLTSAFDFVKPNDPRVPWLPNVSGSEATVAIHSKRPNPAPPVRPEAPFQEPGVRPSRALPYELYVLARCHTRPFAVTLTFVNTGTVGAVLHVYDRLHLDHIPRRYTVEAGKTLEDSWQATVDAGHYDLWVYGPNGFLRELKGDLSGGSPELPEIALEYAPSRHGLHLILTNPSHSEAAPLTLRANAYRPGEPWKISIPAGSRVVHEWSTIASLNWYDFTVVGRQFEHRFAGRMEDGRPAISDPALAI
jgi:phospholipase C